MKYRWMDRRGSLQWSLSLVNGHYTGTQVWSGICFPLNLMNFLSISLCSCHFVWFFSIKLHFSPVQSRFQNSEDAELKNALKLVSFIPLWDSSSTDSEGEQGEKGGEKSTFIPTGSAASTVPNSLYNSLDIVAPSSSSSSSSSSFSFSPSISYRRADELLSWGNVELLEALKGQQQSRFVPKLYSCNRIMLLEEIISTSQNNEFQMWQSYKCKRILKKYMRTYVCFYSSIYIQHPHMIESE